MPRYRIIRDLPDVLAYRGGTRILLEKVSMMYDSYSLIARKDQRAPYSAVVLHKAGARTLDQELAAGFDVVAGSTADKILAALVAKGYAEKLDG